MALGERLTAETGGYSSNRLSDGAPLYVTTDTEIEIIKEDQLFWIAVVLKPGPGIIDERVYSKAKQDDTFKIKKERLYDNFRVAVTNPTRR